MKQRLISLLLLLALCLSVLPTAALATDTAEAAESGTVEAAVVAASAGWVETSSGLRYRKADGTYIKRDFKKIDGNWYYFDAKGYMVTGWKTLNGNRYYFGTDGIRVTKWQTIDGQKYRFNAKGILQKGWITVSGKTYYANKKGVIQTGWKKISGEKYYFLKSGKMVASQTKKIGGKYYSFDSSGKLRPVNKAAQAKRAYKQFVEDKGYLTSDNTYLFTHAPGSEYAIVDINKDGMPELLVYYYYD